jgi:LysM repeat protein
MGDIRRYRLFVTFLAVPAIIIVLIVVVLVNLFGGSADETATGTGTTALEVPTPAVIVAPPDGGESPATTEQLATPLPDATATPAAPPTPEPTPTAVATPTPAPREYVIQDGETLSEIAEANGLTTAELAEFNQIEDPELVFSGQTIVIPSPSGDFVPLPTPAATSTPMPLSGVVNSEDGLNVRAEPDINSERIDGLAAAEEVALTGATHVFEGETWYELEAGGWVLSEYLDITGG